MAGYTFTVCYEVERITGKFASRDEIVEAIMEALEDASPDLDGLGADGESEYEVTDVSIVEVAPARRARA